MTLSTGLMFNQAAQQMRSVQDEITRTQQQISTGLQLTAPSDDPNKTVAISNLNTALSRQNAFLDTLGTVGDQLTAQQSAVTTSISDLDSLNQLAMQAANGTNSGADLQSIAAQMQSLRDDLAAKANSQDVNGNYLFAGGRALTAPFATGSGASDSYGGDQTTVNVAINNQENVTVQQPGTAVFGSVTRTSGSSSTRVGFFQSIDDLIAATKNSDLTGIEQGIGELKTLSNTMTNAQAGIASTQSVVTQQTSAVQQTQVQLKTSLSRIEDSDYTTTITDLQKESISLQAAQQSFAKISQLSLFNYVG